jgi:hypothetical protein
VRAKIDLRQLDGLMIHVGVSSNATSRLVVQFEESLPGSISVTDLVTVLAAAQANANPASLVHGCSPLAWGSGLQLLEVGR